jgi:methylated-DNA-[protein]-cysteine S-methyltransferase
MPSPIGALGIEIVGPTVTRLLIEPAEPQRSAFTPFHSVDGSEFLDEVFGRLSEYFAGARRKLDLEYDLAASGASGLARRVLRETAKVPYGRTRTYQDIADAAGRPEACGEVLSILLENPLPILIPCHRVLASASVIGSYVGGVERKTWLLQMEGCAAELP